MRLRPDPKDLNVMTPAPERPEILDDSIEGNLQRNDAIRVLHLAIASNLIDLPLSVVGTILRDIEEGGYTLRLTTDDERLRRNMEHQ